MLVGFSTSNSAVGSTVSRGDSVQFFGSSHIMVASLSHHFITRDHHTSPVAIWGEPCVRIDLRYREQRSGKPLVIYEREV